MTLRAGDGASLQVDLELALADPLLAILAFWHAGQYLDAALLHVLTGLLIAIRRVTENPMRLQLLILTPWRTSLTVSCVAAAPSIGVESTICSTGASSIPSSSASRKLLPSASRSLPCNSSRARNFVNDVGCQRR